MNPTHLRIATRKSKLALWQANFVKAALEKKYPHLQVSLVEMVTEGDRIQNTTLVNIGGKSVFVKALQEALLRGEADIAVHSMKDMSVYPAPDLQIAAIGERADPRDAFVSTHFNNIAALPHRATVGTSSPRRQCLIQSLRSDLQIQLLRGNVDTRLAKLDAGQYDAIILAAAGLDRLGLSSRIRERLSEDTFTPAIAQGALAIECRLTDTKTRDLLRFFHHEPTAACVTAERAVNQILGGDCHTAIGAYAKMTDGQLHVSAMLGDEYGKNILRASAVGNIVDAQNLGETVGKTLKVLR